MAKWICLAIVAMLLIPNGINEKENVMNEKDAGKEMHSFHPFHSFISKQAFL